MHALEDHKERQDKERVSAGSLWRGSLCVFTTPVGTPVDPRTTTGSSRSCLAERACLPSGCTTCAIRRPGLLVAKGVPPRVVMEILGHSQIALTMNTYSHVAPEVSREAADRMAETLGQDDGDQADEPKVAELEDRQEDGG